MADYTMGTGMVLPIKKCQHIGKSFTFLNPQDTFRKKMVTFFESSVLVPMQKISPDVPFSPAPPSNQVTYHGDVAVSDYPLSAKYLEWANHGVNTAIRYAHPDFPLVSTSFLPTTVDWWMIPVLVNRSSSEQQIAKAIAKEVAKSILSIRTFFSTPSINPAHVEIHAIMADGMWFNCNLVTVWVPMQTMRDNNMATMTLKNLPPSLLVEVIFSFVEARLDIMDAFPASDAYNTPLILPPTPQPTNIPKTEIPREICKLVPSNLGVEMRKNEHATKVFDLRVRLLPDVTLTTPWTAKSISSAFVASSTPAGVQPPTKFTRRSQPTAITADAYGFDDSQDWTLDDDEEDMVQPTQAALDFAERCRQSGQEVPGWAIKKSPNKHYKIIEMRREEERAEDAVMQEADAKYQDTMKLLGF